MNKYLMPAGVVVLLFLIFGVPAILVPATMSNVPERARVKVLTLHQHAVDIVSSNFAHHNNPDAVPGRLAPLPRDSMEWIKLINPAGRKAPGGGHAILLEPNDETGAIGITGDAEGVTIILPAFGGLERQETRITATSVAVQH
ncbi:MAG: hypothetical protein WD002_03015 [Pseudomonadales bacterium]